MSTPDSTAEGYEQATAVNLNQIAMLKKTVLPNSDAPTGHSIAKNDQPERPDRLARLRLIASAYAPLREISCEYDNGTLILAGSVPTYYLKQLAQALVGDLIGVRRVINQIDVRALDCGKHSD